MARNTARSRGVQTGVSSIAGATSSGIAGIASKVIPKRNGTSKTSQSTKYPLNNSALEDTITSSEAQGLRWTTTYGLLKQLGYTQPSIVAQLRSAGWSQSRVESTMQFKPGTLDSLWNSLKQGMIPPVGEVGGRTRGGGAGAAATGGADVAGGGTLGKAALLGGVGAAITSPLDFLKFTAWIFHPRNILRAVEFLVGIVLMAFGFHAALQARGERMEGFTTSEGALTRSGLGRVATELGRATRGGSAPRRPASAPHVTRRRALAQRYTREERVRDRERKGEKPAGHAKQTKGSGAGTRKAPRP